jgi:hypothetical protein
MSWDPRRWAARLRRLAEVPRVAANMASPRLTERVRQQFAQGVDSYGSAWAPLAASTIRRKGHDWILVRSGRTQTTTIARPGGSGSVATITIRSMGWHQYPTAHRPARPILPIAGIPPAWADEVRAAIKRARARALGGP